MLNVAFGEDQRRVRVDSAAQNFAIVRRIVTNLIREDHKAKAGLKIRRRKACMNDRYSARSRGWLNVWRFNVSCDRLADRLGCSR
jgi:hypothetical protein